MKSQNFETHLLESKALPFIYHKDSAVKISKNKIPSCNWHENIEILYALSGKGKVYCDYEFYDFKKSEIFIINSGCMHGVISESGLIYDCLIVDREFCQANDIDTGNIKFRELIRDNALNEKFEKIRDAYKRKDRYAKTAVKSAVLSFLLHLAENYTAEDNYSPKIIHDENIKIAINYIRAHFKEKLTIDDISNEAGLSRYYFSRRFKNKTGVSPITYINILRCENAKKMLAKGNVSIHEAGEKNGFESFSYFAKTFSKYNGCLPSEYIKKL